MTKIKICGFKKLEDALFAHSTGADALGFIVDVPVDTPRKITAQEAREIITQLPPFAMTVGVIMPSDLREIFRIILHTGVTSIQIHGTPPASLIPEVKAKYPVKVFKTYTMEKSTNMDNAIKTIGEYIEKGADGILLDSKGEKGAGGTGKVHDWKKSKAIISSFDHPFILAGGLNPENVEEAIRVVEPYAVDVASGVESAPGIKDYEKIKKFIENVRNN